MSERGRGRGRECEGKGEKWLESSSDPDLSTRSPPTCFFVESVSLKFGLCLAFSLYLLFYLLFIPVIHLRTSRVCVRARVLCVVLCCVCAGVRQQRALVLALLAELAYVGERKLVGPKRARSAPAGPSVPLAASQVGSGSGSGRGRG